MKHFRSWPWGRPLAWRARTGGADYYLQVSPDCLVGLLFAPPRSVSQSDGVGPQNSPRPPRQQVLRTEYENRSIWLPQSPQRQATLRSSERTEDVREPRDENAAATAKADYLRANLSPASGPMETPCLVWRGSSIRGYGSIGYKSHNYRVHRLAYRIANGPYLQVCK